MMKRPPAAYSRVRGVTLVELMVVMVIGLIISIAVGTLFLSSTGGARRQSQLGNLQQSVRTAFNYLAHDARMIGHQGCYTGRTEAGTFNNSIVPADSTNAYGIGVEGYEYRTGATYTIASATPANDTTAGNFETNVAAAGTNTLPLGTIAGTNAGDGLTPGSDVLVIRTIAGGPVRLTVDTVANGNTLAIENTDSGGTCSDGSTAKVSGFCAPNAGSTGSHGLVASCTRARVFAVTGIGGNTLTLDTALDTNVYPAGTSEVFPLQTLAYYVKASSNGRTTSLYRRIFDGDTAGGLEQELIEGVEMLQVRYGVDTTLPDADGVIDEYRDANAVADWSRVVAIRMGLLIRASDALDPGVTVGLSGIVNGVTVTYPVTDRGFDRRLFTTTVAVRNRISYIPPAPPAAPPPATP